MAWHASPSALCHWEASPPAGLSTASSFLGRKGDLDVERLLMPKLPPPMKKHLFTKTPKLRHHIAKEAQHLLDLAKLSGPESVQQMKSAIDQGLEALNHEADLHPLEFKQSLRELEMIEAMTKAQSMPWWAFCGPETSMLPRKDLATFL
ncbi:unnamed protein product [Durusdinium trenchii]|uniref:Uncharacterized protein n=2 Tax=Durusdinium trenchii TaxID=1381693 RepID=A0ABP0IH06_9DINO